MDQSWLSVVLRETGDAERNDVAPLVQNVGAVYDSGALKRKASPGDLGEEPTLLHRTEPDS